MVFDEGKLVEFSSAKSLIMKQDSLFAKMVRDVAGLEQKILEHRDQHGSLFDE